MAARRPWSDLSASYRSRLLGAGRSGKLAGQPLTESEIIAYYEAGGDLRSARSHVPARPSTAAPLGATRAVVADEATAGDLSSLRRWMASGRGPAWLPRSEHIMAPDTAAILSQIPWGPENWKSITVDRIAGGEYEIIVTPKRGYPVRVVLPDGESVGELARWLRTPGAGESGARRAAVERRFSRARFVTAFYGREAAGLAPTPPRATPGGAVTLPLPARERSRTPRKTKKKRKKAS